MKIVNIVCSGDLHQKVNLNSFLELGADLFRYDPEIYHGGYITLSEGKVTLYNSGKYILVGLKDPNTVETCYREMISIIAPFIDCAVVEGPKIKNIVVMDEVPREVHLERFFENCDAYPCEYEPEQFPGLILRTPMGTALIFQTGKLIFPGIKTQGDIEPFISTVKELIAKVDPM